MSHSHSGSPRLRVLPSLRWVCISRHYVPLDEREVRSMSRGQAASPVAAKSFSFAFCNPSLDRFAGSK
jgi:hypothetical protein